MLNQNHIDIRDLLNDIIQIMDKKTKKINTLYFCEITNTGKTMLANLMTSHLMIGTVCRRADRTTFHFNNQLNRTVALMEKLRITMNTSAFWELIISRWTSNMEYKDSCREYLSLPQQMKICVHFYPPWIEQHPIQELNNAN
ncbi:unnamed protein product [Hymenolepis diminuta]|uniref:Parvovirus non-structural protein 1 helicase domain-containing protein n=1 Tax=Hymenolepis diminuta TaxID=6216 RepID=A0A564Y3W9_HYMDI|nr:unnamed protein product [Hymenolepis diminuta]